MPKEVANIGKIMDFGIRITQVSNLPVLITSLWFQQIMYYLCLRFNILTLLNTGCED